MKTTKIIALVLAALIAIASCVLLTGCGKDKKTDKKDDVKETVAATAAPAATQAEDDDEDTPEASEADETPAPTAPAAVDEEGYIDQATAVANVRQQAGTGAQIISVEKGTSPDGEKCWVVVVAPVTTEDGPDTVTYYSGYLFCYAEGVELGSEETAEIGVDQQTAVANVRQQVGTGAQIVSVEEGTSPDGVPCYVVVVAPVTTSEEEVYETYYSGYLFCYKG